MTVPTSGGTPTQISPTGVGVPGFRADFSPDGHTIVFTDDTGSIWTVRSDGTGATKIWQTTGQQCDWTPSWAPNGTDIIVALSPEPNPWAHPANQLVLINADGQNPRVVSQTPDHKRNPTWVPRGDTGAATARSPTGGSSIRHRHCRSGAPPDRSPPPTCVTTPRYDHPRKMAR